MTDPDHELQQIDERLAALLELRLRRHLTPAEQREYLTLAERAKGFERIEIDLRDSVPAPADRAAAKTSH
jgi:hypothetical protein